MIKINLLNNEKRRREKLRKELKKEIEKKPEWLKKINDYKKMDGDYGWKFINRTLMVESLIPKEIFEKHHLSILVLGGHEQEIHYLKKLLKQKGFARDLSLKEDNPNNEKSFEIHQTGLTDKYKTNGTVFHSNVSTADLSKHEKIPKNYFNLFISQFSFYSHPQNISSLLQLYQILKPKGIAILFRAHSIQLGYKLLPKHFKFLKIGPLTGKQIEKLRSETIEELIKDKRIDEFVLQKI